MRLKFNVRDFSNLSLGFARHLVLVTEMASFRVFELSCFRDKFILVSTCPG